MWGWLHKIFGFKPPLPSLVRQACSLDPAARQQAAEQLGAVPESWAAAQLIELLGDSHSVVRETARASLSRRGADGFAALRQGLGHANSEVAAASAELLGALNTAEAVGPLLTALKYAARPVQLASRRALEQLGQLAIPSLEAVLNEPQPWVRKQIEETLSHIKARMIPPSALE
jgi:HEAT repeat protein